jgi:hypothetical protein
MIASEEFSLMRLPHLMSHASQNWRGRYVFFLHVPKTAGTSTRLALIKSTGVPALSMYAHRDELDAAGLVSVRFWPLFAGHRQIDAFPESHRGITILRESRSRYLSVYRQVQRASRASHLLTDKAEVGHSLRAREAIELSFNEWFFKRNWKTLAGYFVPGQSVAADRSLAAASEAVARSMLDRSFDRFDAAAWSHDEDAIVKAISLVTGDPEPILERHNEYTEPEEFRVEPIGPETLARLESFRAIDDLAFGAAADRGLVPTLSRSEADALFETTARRLGFTLP